MPTKKYRITKPTAALDEGDVLVVTARYGNWHPDEMHLETSSPTRSKKIVVTEQPTGFTEAEVLDPTARIGDWHEFDLAFDPETESADRTMESPGPAYISTDDLHTIAEPV
jgi:hypothetical protein